jgi:hypothetical protein
VPLAVDGLGIFVPVRALAASARATRALSALCARALFGIESRVARIRRRVRTDCRRLCFARTSAVSARGVHTRVDDGAGGAGATLIVGYGTESGCQCSFSGSVFE